MPNDHFNFIPLGPLGNDTYLNEPTINYMYTPSQNTFEITTTYTGTITNILSDVLISNAFS